MKIAVLDLETDPFEYGKMVRPFVAGFYDGETYSTFWHETECIEKMCSFLEAKQEPYTIYAHNGGRFDWFYFLEHINKQALRIINGRIVQCMLGIHELRDSFSILPFPLADYKKTPINYEWFKRGIRDQHHDEIISYLRDDCVDLHALVTAFVSEFGPKLTVGSASFAELKKFHAVKSGNEIFDAKFRDKFYFGGRNQVFKSGVFKAPIHVYDVNSMYPAVMRDCLHPISTGVYVDTKIVPETAFVTVTGKNYGAFPVREIDGSLSFTRESGTFHTTIHEFKAAEDTGTFKPIRIEATYGFTQRISFDDFVTHFYDARAKAKAEGDKIKTLLYKFVMNSCYGKFAQNPENYFDWFICAMGEFPPDFHECSKSCAEPCRKRWSPCFVHNNYIIWQRPLKTLNYYNIATGASITGASRAVLLKGLSHATNPYYCDTDSIICDGLNGVVVSETYLGAWKLEATGDRAAICGKKLYAIFNGKECIKKAHKGARLTGEQILQIARGAEIETCNPVPAFRFDGTYTFTKRTIRRTHGVTTKRKTARKGGGKTQARRTYVAGKT